MEQRLRGVEGRFGEAQGAADAEFAPLGEALDGLKRGLQKERGGHEGFMLGKSARLKEVKQTLRGDLDAMQQAPQEGGEWAMRGLQHLYVRVKGEHSESLARAQGLQEESKGVLGTLLPDMRGKLVGPGGVRDPRAGTCPTADCRAPRCDPAGETGA